MNYFVSPAGKRGHTVKSFDKNKTKLAGFVT